MRNFQKTVCVAIAFASFAFSEAQAQQSVTFPNSIRNSERMARASWAPTRHRTTESRVDQNSSSLNLMPAPLASTAKRATANRTSTQHRQATGRAGQVRQAQHIVRGSLPAPRNLHSTGRTVGAVISGPYSDGGIVEGPVLDAGIVEGQIIDGGRVTEVGPLVDGHVGESYPLDGQIDYAPVAGDIYEGNAECGCDDGACDAGGCDSIGSCGTGGCTNGCGGNCSMCGELASGEAWRPAITLRLPQDGWVSVEALHWWQDGMRLPALVTTSTGTGVTRDDAGVLGKPQTAILFGGEDVLDSRFDGFRLKFGFWLDRCHTWGVGAEYFHIGLESEDFIASSNGDRILARPFFNTQTGLEDSELVSFPGVISGTVTARATSELYGGGFHFKRLRCCQEGCKSWLFCGCDEHFCSRTEAMVGYRYLQLDEDIGITENLVSSQQNNPGSFNIRDSFDTRNQFNGIDFGWKHRVTRGYWTYDCLMRMAIGNTRQTVRIDGRTVISDPNNPPPTTLEGGLLAQTSNIGIHKQDEFTIVPEFNANVGYQLTDHLRAMLGYSFIYWSNVVRPGDQISTDLNPNLLPPQANPLVGVQRPGFAFDTTDYWVQGFSYGLEYRW
ncbi:MAG: BBP7 family outer membrane beta-barrel protein [Pirellulaceae bacterium]|nr:BBP7 family outer membrane beta-barrel protein [Pirellulaceae bacterium]